MVGLRVRETGAVLATDLELARGVWSRTRGLMLRRTLESGKALDIRPCSSIHMMFMRFPIDAVFYDRDGTVTRVARNVRPWVGIAFGGRGARGVVELPVGAATAVAPGETLVFDDPTEVAE